MRISARKKSSDADVTQAALGSAHLAREAYLPNSRTQAEDGSDPHTGDSNSLANVIESAVSWMMIALLAWVQFPLGSNRPWSWSLLVLLIAAIWIAWLPAAFLKSKDVSVAATRIAGPAFCIIPVFLWGFLQTVPWTPVSWHNAVWSFMAQGIGVQPTSTGSISVNPFETTTEIMKLMSYVAIGWISYIISQRHVIARRLFIAIIFVGAGYAIYGLILSLLKTSQITLFDNIPPPYGSAVSGGFVAKNSFATFAGICLIANILFICDLGKQTVVANRGARQLIASTLKFVMGHGVPAILSAVILFVALVGSQSRAGMIATLSALFVLSIYAILVALRRRTARWALGAFAATFAIMVFLFLANGQDLESRFDNLIETRGTEELRPVMWGAAVRIIESNTLFGTGLGTFKDSYNLYADEFAPFVFDRVHNDYLELTLGLGVPAAMLWLLGLAWINVACILGVRRRRRRRLYGLSALGATALVAVHSIFDFSLQMPAVAVLYAVLLGMGLSQSWGHEQRGEIAS